MQLPSDTASGAIPISAELWARLRQFDPQCTINMSRGQPYARDRQNDRRTWRVTVRHEDAKAWEAVHTEDLSLADALKAAIDEGERRGWHERSV